MKRFLTGIGVLGLLTVSTLGQNSEKSTVPIAEIHEANPNGLVGVQAGIDPMSGLYVGGGLYRVRSASMLQLIAAAYGVGVDKVADGPSWLAFNRYDITAKLPPGTTPDTIKTMVQTLLADRFKLAVHNGESPLDVWAIKATSASRKTSIRRFPRCVTWCGNPGMETRARRMIVGPRDKAAGKVRAIRV